MRLLELDVRTWSLQEEHHSESHLHPHPPNLSAQVLLAGLTTNPCGHMLTPIPNLALPDYFPTPRELPGLS